MQLAYEMTYTRRSTAAGADERVAAGWAVVLAGHHGIAARAFLGAGRLAGPRTITYDLYRVLW